MRDDGVAIAVAENIGNKLRNVGLEVIIGETDFQFSFHSLNNDDFIIIIDALYTADTPGIVHIYNLQEAAFGCRQTCSQHEIGIFDLMRLYSKPLRGYLIGIEIAEAGYGFELSEVLLNKFDDICLQVEHTIHKIVKEEQNA